MLDKMLNSKPIYIVIDIFDNVAETYTAASQGIRLYNIYEVRSTWRTHNSIYKLSTTYASWSNLFRADIYQ